LEYGIVCTQAIIHAVNKQKIIQDELHGLELEADRLYPRDLPNCDVDLEPEFTFDQEQARSLLNSAGGKRACKLSCKANALECQARLALDFYLCMKCAVVWHG